MKMLVISDLFIKEKIFWDSFQKLNKDFEARIVNLDPYKQFVPVTPSEKSIKEYVGSPQQLIEELQKFDAEILVIHAAPVTAEVMKAGKSLRLIACARGGPVNVDIDAAKNMGILVINAPGRNADAVADFTIGLIIAETRHIARAHMKLVTEGLWRDKRYFDAVELNGKTLGLVGFGNVGRRVAIRARCLGMKVLVYDPYIANEKVEKFGATMVDLETLMSSSDFISPHARLTSKTQGLIGRKEISLMKTSAYLINTSRGMIIDEKALYDALKEKRIAGAALDVFQKEPTDPNNPLLKLNNITVTPHIAGTTEEVPFHSAQIIVEELERFIKGEKLRFTLNK